MRYPFTLSVEQKITQIIIRDLGEGRRDLVSERLVLLPAPFSKLLQQRCATSNLLF